MSVENPNSNKEILRLPKYNQQAVSVCSGQRYECADSAEVLYLKSSDVPTPHIISACWSVHLNIIYFSVSEKLSCDLLVLVVGVETGAGTA